eukprot:3416417-Rhodomonas_salina.1
MYTHPLLCEIGELHLQLEDTVLKLGRAHVVRIHAMHVEGVVCETICRHEAEVCTQASRQIRFREIVVESSRGYVVSRSAEKMEIRSPIRNPASARPTILVSLSLSLASFCVRRGYSELSKFPEPGITGWQARSGCENRVVPSGRY